MIEMYHFARSTTEGRCLHYEPWISLLLLPSLSSARLRKSLCPWSDKLFYDVWSSFTVNRHCLNGFHMSTSNRLSRLIDKFLISFCILCLLYRSSEEQFYFSPGVFFGQQLAQRDVEYLIQSLQQFYIGKSWSVISN